MPNAVKLLTVEAWPLIFTALVIFASISASYGVSQHQLNKHEARLESVEENVNQNENLLIKIANDVSWIRTQIKKFNGE
tara:strand:- start:3422 stop:3658 length:237 start_codon:yes stop_codon:yes gene_type:complete